MSTKREGRLQKSVLIGAIAAGLAAGSYGIASAASNDSGSSSSSGTTAARPTTPAPPGQGGLGGGQPWGGQRSDETPLTAPRLSLSLIHI